jgi:hypothetical protein
MMLERVSGTSCLVRCWCGATAKLEFADEAELEEFVATQSTNRQAHSS